MSVKLPSMRTSIPVHFAVIFQSWRSELLIPQMAPVGLTTETLFAILTALFTLALAAVNTVGAGILQHIAAPGVSLDARHLPARS